jgi:hypothetical protein
MLLTSWIKFNQILVTIIHVHTVVDTSEQGIFQWIGSGSEECYAGLNSSSNPPALLNPTKMQA